MNKIRALSLFLVISTGTPLAAQQNCVGIADDASRLECFDQVFGKNDRIAPPSVDTTDVTPAETDVDIVTAISDALSENAAIELINLVVKAENISTLPEEMREQAAEIILDYVRPLSASEAKANRDGYKALSILEPDNATYQERVAIYAAALAERAASILGRMRTEVDDFTGTIFYEHAETPQDPASRSYLAVYAGKNGERVWLRLRLNYTNDTWLFVQSAALNIDGEIIPLPFDDLLWERDNSSTVWEWIDVEVDQNLRDILEKVAASKSTVVRFNGKKYSDNVTVSDKDKDVIRDMFTLEKALDGAASQ